MWRLQRYRLRWHKKITPQEPTYLQNAPVTNIQNYETFVVSRPAFEANLKQSLLSRYHDQTNVAVTLVSRQMFVGFQQPQLLCLKYRTRYAGCLLRPESLNFAFTTTGENSWKRRCDNSTVSTWRQRNALRPVLFRDLIRHKPARVVMLVAIVHWMFINTVWSLCGTAWVLRQYVAPAANCDVTLTFKVPVTS